ncbi:MAG: hypothetical protein NTW79_03070 [Candidatus Berkelbacteria bacterium]|nr:hypothetical protein [Candidatus Berkelbacteria bacterium]
MIKVHDHTVPPAFSIIDWQNQVKNRQWVFDFWRSADDFLKV